MRLTALIPLIFIFQIQTHAHAETEQEMTARHQNEGVELNARYSAEAEQVSNKYEAQYEKYLTKTGKFPADESTRMWKIQQERDEAMSQLEHRHDAEKKEFKDQLIYGSNRLPAATPGDSSSPTVNPGSGGSQNVIDGSQFPKVIEFKGPAAQPPGAKKSKR